MRQAVVIIATANWDEAALVWAACVRDRIVCVIPSRRRDSDLCRKAVREVVERVAVECDVEPRWPPECSESVAEG